MRGGGSEHRTGRRALWCVSVAALVASLQATPVSAADPSSPKRPIPGRANLAGPAQDAAPAPQKGALTAPPGSTVPAEASPDDSVVLAGVQAFATTGGGSVENGEVIFEVHLRRDHRLSGGMIAHIQGNDLLVPIQELMLLLQLAIQETPKGAEGWFVNEDQRFRLDLAAGEVVSAGKTFRVKPGEVRRIDKELFVSVKALSEWLPLNFYVNFRALTLHVNPRGQVPLDERAQRAKKKYGSIYQFRSELPKQQTPYDFISPPAIEVDAASGYSSRRGGSFYNAGTVRAFGDLMMMNGELFVTGTDRGVSDARIRLGRSDPDGGLLGPLNATAWEIGDVGAVNAPLVSGGASGRGVRITSRPEAYVAEFDRVTIEDSLPVNHEVELYRNGILMNSSGPSTSGRFRFENVPLLRGANEIRLEFYGPQGQRRTEVKQYFVGEGQVPVGKLNYEASVNEVGRSVFGLSNFLRYNQLYENYALGGGLRFDYGLTRNVSLTGGLVAQPLPIRDGNTGDDYRYYGTLGARTMIGNFFVALDTALDDHGGVAGGATLSTSYGNWNFSGRHEQFANGFASDASFGASSALRNYTFRTSNSTARADTHFSNIWPGVYFNWGVIGGHTTYENTDATWRAGATMGLSAGRFSFSNDVFYGGSLTQKGGDGIFGNSRVNYRLFDGISLRASADWDLRDAADIEGYAAGLTAALPWDVTLGLGYAQRYDRYRDFERTENYFGTLRRKFDWAEVGLLAAYGRYDQRDLEDDFRVAMTMSFSTFTDPATLGTRISSDRIAREGAIRARTYQDYNQNGVRDDSEPFVGDVRVLHAGQRTPYYTAPAGTIGPMANVGAGGWTDITIDRAGLPDATLSPGSRGVAVLPRPGVVSEIELPIVATAGVQGNVNLKLGKELRALPNVKVQVVRPATGHEQEKVVAEVHTEFDGVYSLANVPVGTYVIRIEPEQARQIGARAPVERKITLSPETGILENVSLDLARS